MGRLFEFIASGAVLYFVLGALALLAALIVWKWPIITYWIMWPFKALWGKFSKSRYGVWVTSSKPYLWLEKQQYDPPPKALTWWVSRGLVVLFFWAIISAMVWVNGVRHGRLEVVANLPAAGSAHTDVTLLRRMVSDLDDKYRTCRLKLEAASLPEVAPVRILDIPTVAGAPPSSSLKAAPVKAMEPLKKLRTVCQPEWWCKLDKTVGLSK